MTSCTNSWVQSNSGQVLDTTVANIPSYRPKPQDQEIVGPVRYDNIHHHTREHSEKTYIDEDESSIISDTQPESLDGESLDTRDWMDLVARGTVLGQELEDSCYPMTIEFEVSHSCMSDDLRTLVSSDESMEWTDDDSSETSEVYFSSSDGVTRSTLSSESEFVMR